MHLVSKLLGPQLNAYFLDLLVPFLLRDAHFDALLHLACGHYYACEHPGLWHGPGANDRSQVRHSGGGEWTWDEDGR
jgi:hypothetical protein